MQCVMTISDSLWFAAMCSKKGNQYLNSSSKARNLSATPLSLSCESHSEIFGQGEYGYTSDLRCRNTNLQVTLKLGTHQNQILVLTLVG